MIDRGRAEVIASESLMCRTPTALGVGTLVSVISTLIWPDNYDFAAHTIESYDKPVSAASEYVEKAAEPATPSEEDDTKKADLSKSYSREVKQVAEHSEVESVADLQKAFKLAVWASGIMTLVLIILVRHVMRHSLRHFPRYAEDNLS